MKEGDWIDMQQQQQQQHHEATDDVSQQQHAVARLDMGHSKKTFYQKMGGQQSRDSIKTLDKETHP